MFSHCIRCFTPCQVLYIFPSLWFKALIIFSLSGWLPGSINIQMHSDYLCFSEFFAFCTRKTNNKRNKSVSFKLHDAYYKMKLQWIQNLWKLGINQLQSTENFHLGLKVATQSQSLSIDWSWQALLSHKANTFLTSRNHTVLSYPIDQTYQVLSICSHFWGIYTNFTVYNPTKLGHYFRV